MSDASNEPCFPGGRENPPGCDLAETDVLSTVPLAEVGTAPPDNLMMRSFLPRSSILASLCVVAIGCASAGTKPSDEAHIQPPTLLSATQPDWPGPTSAREGRIMNIRVDVLVDAAGRPDLETLHVTGVGSSAENRDAVANWLTRARFRPAQHAGQPVPGVFKTRFEMSVRIRG